MNDDETTVAAPLRRPGRAVQEKTVAAPAYWTPAEHAQPGGSSASSSHMASPRSWRIWSIAAAALVCVAVAFGSFLMMQNLLGPRAVANPSAQRSTVEGPAVTRTPRAVFPGAAIHCSDASGSTVGTAIRQDSGRPESSCGFIVALGQAALSRIAANASLTHFTVTGVRSPMTQKLYTAECVRANHLTHCTGAGNYPYGVFIRDQVGG